MRMPFGKYKGYRMDQIPPGYLCWLLYESNSETAIKDAARAQLVSHFSEPHSGRCERCERLQTEWPRIFRRLAATTHPDMGGSETAMKVANLANELVMQ